MNCPERGFMPRKSLTEWSAKPLTFGMAPQVPSLVYPGVTSVNRSIEALKNLMFLRIFSGIRLPTNAMIIPTRTVSKVPEKPTQSTYISPQLSLSLFKIRKNEPYYNYFSIVNKKKKDISGTKEVLMQITAEK